MLFLYSAYAKAFPVQAFEMILARQFHFSHRLAEVVARLMIGIEAALGGCLATSFLGSGAWVRKAAVYLTVVFTIWVAYLWVRFGNAADCGCFSNHFTLSPFWSLIKNAVIISVLLVLKGHKGIIFKFSWVVPLVVMIVAFILPFIFFPFFKPYKANLAGIYTTPDQSRPAMDITHGKCIVAFVSPSCHYCLEATTKLLKMKSQDTSLPIFLAIANTKRSMNEFWDKTGQPNMPFTELEGPVFMRYTNGSFPQVYWVNNDSIVANIDYPDLQIKTIQDWVRK